MNLAVMAGHRLIVGQSVSNKAHAALTATRLQYTSVRPNPPGALDRAGAGQEVVAGKGEVARSIDGPALELTIAWEAKTLFDVTRDALACDMAMLAWIRLRHGSRLHHTNVPMPDRSTKIC